MSHPTISIGLPIKNGAGFLDEAIQSLLGQSYGDFELIISDNASTDATQSICERYAASDSRIRYLRRPKDMGVIDNFNFVFKESSGKYFKWAAADDICGSRFLELCVKHLDGHPDTALVFTASQIKYYGTDDEVASMVSRGEPAAKEIDFSKDLNADNATKRFAAILSEANVGTIIYGLIRRDLLEETGLHQLEGSDRLLLSELALRGRFYMVHEPQFIRRVHTENYDRSRRDYVRMVKGQEGGKILTPPWRWPMHYLRAIDSIRLPRSIRMACKLAVIKRTLHIRYLSRLFVPGPENYWGVGGVSDELETETKSPQTQANHNSADSLPVAE